MDWSLEMELNLIALNRYEDLAHAITQKLDSSPEDMRRSYDALNLLLSSGEAPKATDPYALHSHQRHMEAQDKAIKRTARCTIFASAYSSVERFLILRLGLASNSNFGAVDGRLKSRLKHISDGDCFWGKWNKFDMYRIARHKILHQSGLVSREDLKEPELPFFDSPVDPYFFEDVSGLNGVKQIVINELGLCKYLSFLQKLSLEVDQMLREVEC